LTHAWGRCSGYKCLIIIAGGTAIVSVHLRTLCPDDKNDRSRQPGAHSSRAIGTTHVVLSTGEAIMGYESTGLNMRLVIRALLTEVAHSLSDFGTQTGMELITGAGIRFGPQWNTLGLRVSSDDRLGWRVSRSNKSRHDCPADLTSFPPWRSTVQLSQFIPHEGLSVAPGGTPDAPEIAGQGSHPAKSTTASASVSGSFGVTPKRKLATSRVAASAIPRPSARPTPIKRATSPIAQAACFCGNSGFVVGRWSPARAGCDNFGDARP